MAVYDIANGDSLILMIWQLRDIQMLSFGCAPDRLLAQGAPVSSGVSVLKQLVIR